MQFVSKEQAEEWANNLVVAPDGRVAQLAPSPGEGRYRRQAQQRRLSRVDRQPPPVSCSQRYLIFAAAILVTGVVAGVAGASTTLLLRGIEHLTYGYTQGPMLVGVKLAPIMRRLIGPALGCALAGLGWWLLRRNTAVPRLNDSIRRDRPFAQVPMTLDALLQVLAVGVGASLGREQAPRLFAATCTEMLIRLGSIPLPHRRILLASAAGAGLAAVYNVPAAGALFAVGIVLRTWRPVAVLVAVATSCIATVTAWPVSHGAATFLWPQTHFTRASFMLAIVAMPFAALTGTGFNALVRRAGKKAPPPSWLLIPAIGLAGLLTGTTSIWLPQMPGNGKDIILESLAGDGTLAGAALALALKPALTALFIRAGAVGGMLTPALATGVAMGSVLALTINHLGGHASVPTLALIGGAAVLGITQRAPVFAAVFTAELTHPPPQVWVMLLVAALGAQGVRVMAIRRQAARELRSVQIRSRSRNSSRRRLIGTRAADFNGAALAEFLSDLAKKVQTNAATLTQFQHLHQGAPVAVVAPDANPASPLSRAETWRQIEQDLDPKTTLLVETGDSWLNGIYTRLPGGARFEIEMQWGRSAGPSPPASATQWGWSRTGGWSQSSATDPSS